MPKFAKLDSSIILVFHQTQENTTLSPFSNKHKRLQLTFPILKQTQENTTHIPHSQTNTREYNSFELSNLAICLFGILFNKLFW